MAVGDAVRHLREQRGWSQQTLADMTRFAQGTIANIEANKHRYPRQDTLMRLAAAFDMTVDGLLQVAQNSGWNLQPSGEDTPSEAVQNQRILAEIDALILRGSELGFALDKATIVQQLRLDQIRKILLALMDSPREDQVAIAGHIFALWERRKLKGQQPTLNYIPLDTDP